MKLTMVGAGYVGLVSGSGFASTGNHVTCLDLDEKKIATLKRGDCPIYEPGLKELIARNVGADRLVFTTDKNIAYIDAEIILICVGTPASEVDGSIDLSAVMSAAKDIASAIDQCPVDSQPKLIVVKSTVPVGTTIRLRDLISSRTNHPFAIANNPEFLKEGAAVNDFLRPDRVICGVEDEATAQTLRNLYDPFVRQGNPIIITDIPSSEMIKYASNAMLACKISFINEIANLCEYYGADIRSVREGMTADKRIGNQFLHPGLGFGGSCFPKDILGVIGMGKSVGYDCKVAAAVHEVNQDQRQHFWRKISEHFSGNLKDKTLAFWGVAFKPETDDIREAPSITLMKEAIAAGASVRAFDPVALENLAKVLPNVIAVSDMYEVLRDCDALVISTEWSEFRQPDFTRMHSLLKKPIIFDGRNIYRRESMLNQGFTYYSVGQDPVGADANRFSQSKTQSPIKPR